MIRYSIAVLIALVPACLAFGSSGSVAGELYTISAGGWDGYASSDDDGHFSHCYISGEYAGGTTIGFALTKEYEFNLGLFNPDWDLSDDDEYAVNLFIDDGFVGSYVGDASVQSGLIFRFGNNVYEFDKIRLGYVLDIETAITVLSFKLTGTNAALKRLKFCVDENMAQDYAAKNPFSGNSAGGLGRQGQNPFGAGDNSSSREMARSFESILNVSGIANAEVVVNSDKTSTELVSWTISGSENTGGSIFAFVPEEEGMEKLSANLVSIYASNCRGRVASGIEEMVRLDGVWSQSFQVICHESEGSYIVYASVLLDDANAVLVNSYTDADAAGDVFVRHNALAKNMAAILVASEQ